MEQIKGITANITHYECLVMIKRKDLNECDKNTQKYKMLLREIAAYQETINHLEYACGIAQEEYNKNMDRNWLKTRE